VVSTHYPRPYSPPERDLEIMKRYAELAGRVMADHLRTPSLTSMANGRPHPSIA